MKHVQIIIPVYNEEKCLAQSISTLITFLKKSAFPYAYTIIIADNASQDKTPQVGKKLEKTHAQVRYVRIDRKGRGLALRKTWLAAQKSDCACYMDVDLSTDLKHIRPLVEAIIIDKQAIAIGNRLGKQSFVEGRMKTRELFSRTYNLLLKLTFWNRIDDYQCGFKAVNPKLFAKLEPEIINNNWFFDTELILLAGKRKMPIRQIDVHWVDDYDSRVKLFKTVNEYVRAIMRMRLKFWKENIFGKHQ